MASYRKLSLILLCAGMQLLIGGCRKQKEQVLVRKLLSKEWEEVAEARDGLLAAGKSKELIAALINLIDGKKNRNEYQAGVETAMFILGEVRAVKAVPVLVDHIGYPYCCEPGEGPNGGPIIGMGNMVSRLSEYPKIFPAVVALIKIGEPCLNDLVTGLGSTKSWVDANTHLSVLVGIRGRESAVEMLKDAVERETDAKKRDRLQWSLDWLSQMPEDQI